MSAGVPGRIIEVAPDGLVATVDFFGVRRIVRLALVGQPVAPGDYVLHHVDYAIQRIPESDIAETLALYEEWLRAASDGDDEDLAAAITGGAASES
jgi:hydrogenase expression/formation protein HypC